jgi:hypothetical protein
LTASGKAIFYPSSVIVLVLFHKMPLALFHTVSLSESREKLVARIGEVLRTPAHAVVRTHVDSFDESSFFE